MKKVLKILGLMLIFGFCFSFLTRLLSPKYQDSLVEGHMIKEYYSEEKNHEVIFIGDCEVYANFSPLVMYEEEGITAYVRGTSQQLIWQSYGILKETLKYEKPKVVVFNVNALRYDEPVSEAYNRLTLDNMKWSREKLEIIQASMLEEENLFDYIFPILRYHSRFSKLTSEDFKYFFNEKNVTFNGFLINKNIKPVTTLPTKKVLPTYDFSDNVMKYLDRLTSFCEEHGIKLVLIKAPSVYPYWYEEYDRQIKEYAYQNNLDYYNFQKVVNDIGIDYQTDTYDGGLHLNLSGATKLSKYFAHILKENYILTDYRNNEAVNNLYQTKLIEYNKAIKEQ